MKEQTIHAMEAITNSIIAAVIVASVITWNFKLIPMAVGYGIGSYIIIYIWKRGVKDES